jgi:hypothetical protein
MCVPVADRSSFSFSNSSEYAAFEDNPMKAVLMRLLALLFLAGMAFAARGLADTDFKSLFAKHWQISKEFTLAVAEAMPAESYNFKPNPE